MPLAPLLVLALCASAAVAQVAPRGGAGDEARSPEADFGRGLQRITGHLQSERWQPALDDLHVLLQRHARRPYVALRRDDLRAIQALSTFKLEYRPPHPRELVAGELTGWDPDTGRLALTYPGLPRGRFRGETLPPAAPPELRLPAADFEASGDTLVHPAVFDGPYTITVTGTRLLRLRDLPPAWRLRSARVLVARHDGGHHEVWAGFPGGGHGKIRALDLDDRRELDDRPRDDLDLDDTGPYRFVVRVDRRRIVASLDGVDFLSADNAAGRFGGWGLTGFPHVRRIEIEGDSDGRWIEGLLAEHERAARAAFDGAYDPDDDLPGWLAAGP